MIPNSNFPYGKDEVDADLYLPRVRRRDHRGGRVMAEHLYKLTFESVSAIQHPEVYQGHRDRVTPGLDVSAIPEDWWTLITTDSRTEQAALDQWVGLHELIEEGEPIRNVRMFRSAEPTWEPCVVEPRTP